jgi:hypothetical protein
MPKELQKREKFNWSSDGPSGCDSHGIDHPCGRCMQDAGFKFEPLSSIPMKPDHEPPPKQVYPDIDLCSACRDHATFFETDNGARSECCDAPPIDTDPNFEPEIFPGER